MATGATYYALENLVDVYSRRFPHNTKVIELLNLIVFSPGPVEDQTVDEAISLIYR